MSETPTERAARILGDICGNWGQDNRFIPRIICPECTDSPLNALATEFAMAEAIECGADTERLEWMQEHHASVDWGGFLTRRGGFDPTAARIDWLDPETGDWSKFLDCAFIECLCVCDLNGQLFVGGPEVSISAGWLGD